MSTGASSPAGAGPRHPSVLVVEPRDGAPRDRDRARGSVARDVDRLPPRRPRHIVAARFRSGASSPAKGEPPAPLPEHRATKIAGVRGKRAKLYEQRQQVLNLGPNALALHTEVTHRAPKLAGQRVEEPYVLPETHGDDTSALRIATDHAGPPTEDR